MTSQVMTSVVSSKKGSMYAVDGSGMRIMSEAWMPFQPPARSRRRVAVLEVLFLEGRHRQADVMFLAANIREAQVHEAHFVFLDHLHDVLGVHFDSW